MEGQGHGEIRARDVTVAAGNVVLNGILSLPPGAQGMVVFAHGSGSGRLSPRNNFVAGVLNDGGLGTLLVDLLTEEEGDDRRLVFDIDLLTERLRLAMAGLRGRPETNDLVAGYFGASTGAAAALRAVAREGQSVGAVVARGGRPDLAWDDLPAVTAPTLLIVGGDDEPVVMLNRRAYDRLRCEKRLVIIPGATHLFPEPGALEEVAALARDWFNRHLARPIERSA